METLTKTSKTSLCNPCTNLMRRARDKPGHYKGQMPSRFSFPPRKDSWQGSHLTHRGSLFKGLKHGCPICHHLYRAAPSALRKYAGYFQSYYELRKGAQDEWNLRFTLEISAEVRDRGGVPRVIECPGTFRVIPTASLYTMGNYLDASQYSMEGRVPVPLEAWLQSCRGSEEGHKICQSFPTVLGQAVNLLRINSHDRENLPLEKFSGGSKLPRYATVSYSRGVEMCKTAGLPLAGVFQNSRTTVPLTTLPGSVQKAVHFARDLGISYMWLECLGTPYDTVDAPSQSSQIVGQMFSGSYCNIAVVSQSADSEPFAAGKRKTGLLQPVFVESPSCASGKLTHIVEYDDLWCSALLDADVHKQASTLQERLLSPRTVHIGGVQTFWECRAHKACEAHPQGIPTQFLNNKAHAWNPTTQIVPEIQKLAMRISNGSESGAGPEKSPLPPPSTSARQVFYEYWSNVVRLYMLGDQALPTDKLRGLQGLVSVIQSFIGEKPFAGIWVNDRLAEALLWFVIRRQQGNGQASSRPDAYRAPSWSWASIDAQIRWNWHIRCRKTLAQVEIPNVQDVTGNSWGGSEPAEMRIRGCPIPVRIEAIHSREDGSPLEDGSYALLPKGTQLHPFNQDTLLPQPTQEPIVYLDEALEFRPARDAYLLPICTGWPDHTGSVASEVAGLILQKTRKDENVVYERLGVYALGKPAVTFLSSIFTEHKDTLSGVVDACPSDSIVLV